jgi:hypothetical protein
MDRQFRVVCICRVMRSAFFDLRSVECDPHNLIAPYDVHVQTVRIQQIVGFHFGLLFFPQGEMGAIVAQLVERASARRSILVAVGEAIMTGNAVSASIHAAVNIDSPALSS